MFELAQSPAQSILSYLFHLICVALFKLLANNHYVKDQVNQNANLATV